MKLQGKVLKSFNDKETGKLYTPKDEYKEADLFVADKPRYEKLYSLGYVEKGKLYEEIFVNKKKEEK